MAELVKVKAFVTVQRRINVGFSHSPGMYDGVPNIKLAQARLYAYDEYVRAPWSDDRVIEVEVNGERFSYDQARLYRG